VLTSQSATSPTYPGYFLQERSKIPKSIKKIYFITVAILMTNNDETMEVLNGTTIFWLIALGLVVAGLTKLVLWSKGADLKLNLLFGVTGSILLGSISIVLQMPGSFLFAMLGSLSILFILNVFLIQEGKAHT
jgi:hypothetical protein